MASVTTEQHISRVDEEEERQEQHDHRLVDRDHGVVAREAVSKRVSRLAVEGGSAGAGGSVVRSGTKHEDYAAHGRRAGGGGAPGRTLPPPHAWLAIDDMKKHNKHGDNRDPEEEQWARLLRGGDAGMRHHQQQHRRSSFCVVRRERAAREAWLDRAWEAKRSWHQRNGGAPDADTPVVVVVGKAAHAASPESEQQQQQHEQQHQAAGAVGGGGVAMDVEEVRACRDLGLELPSDCTVEIQCYGLSGATSPTNTAGSSNGADSPCGVISSPGADPMDVKARLKVWAQAVALASTTHLGS